MADTRRLLILADDFTGACDAAAGFAAARATLVLHGVPRGWPDDAEAVEVLSVDLDLRERSNDHAEAIAREAARQLCSTEPHADVLLKIDSTLRGPIAGLVTGTLAGSARAVAVLAPAFPEQGRLFRDGRVYVDGEPGASLMDALGMEHTALLGAHFARSAEDVEVAVEHAHARGAMYVVVDADGVRNLQSVASAWRRHPEWLLVGSAGLARQIAGGTSLRPNAGMVRTGRGPILVVAGSPTLQTQAQLERLRGLGPIVVVGAETPPSEQPQGIHELIVVCTPAATERDAGESARAVAETIAAWATSVASDAAAGEGENPAADSDNAPFRPGAVVLTGGATARFVCQRLGASGVRLQGEFQPGVPHGTLNGGPWHGVHVVTKAGGFGTPATLLDVVRALGVSSIAEPTHD